MNLDDVARKLLWELDRIARDYDHYEYGLPIADEPVEQMLGLIRGALEGAMQAATEEVEANVEDTTKWVALAVAAERERCAKICDGIQARADEEWERSAEAAAGCGGAGEAAALIRGTRDGSET